MSQMSTQQNKRTSELAALYALFLAKESEEWRTRCAVVCRDRAHGLARLRKQGVVTVADLLERLPSLGTSLQRFGIELTSLLELRLAVPVLLELMSDRSIRVDCAFAIYMLKPNKTVTRRFIEIGNRELASNTADRRWLEAVIQGLGSPDDRAGVELLVAIFERRDLPGWLRGDAADKLGCCHEIQDRRGKLFRRCRETALAGLRDESIDVQFWSMYLIGSLCSEKSSRRSSNLRDFASALAPLRRIAASDQRLSPGFWWPMSAEAEDVLGSIQTGMWPSQDAGERWLGNTKRGEMCRD